ESRKRRTWRSDSCVPDPPSDTDGLQLFDDADFGAAVLGPGRFVLAGIGWHFHAEANGLNTAGIDTLGNESFAERAGAAIAQAAIVFGGNYAGAPSKLRLGGVFAHRSTAITAIH